MSPKEEAVQLIKEFGNLNGALICASEIIYDFKHYTPNKEKLEYWIRVKEELEEMRPK